MCCKVENGTDHRLREELEVQSGTKQSSISIVSKMRPWEAAGGRCVMEKAYHSTENIGRVHVLRAILN